MVYLELRRILDIRCYKCSRVATCWFNDGHWSYVETGFGCYRCRSYHYCGRCSAQRDHRSKAAYLFSCTESIIFWLLVQLFYCGQQSSPSHVLVWNTGIIIFSFSPKSLICEQTYNGSECVYQMLKAIWPSIARVPSHLPESAHITTVGLMCYFIYWLIQFPLMLVSPQKIRYFFTAKSIIVPFAWMAILIWAMVKVPAKISLASKGSSLSGSSLRWAWLNSLNSALGFYATVSINIPDFARYAKTERGQLVQLFIIPTAFTLVGFAGIAITSAGQHLYGILLWDPFTLIDHWDNRAAAFFASFSFLLSIIGANISANSLSAANDLMAMFPKYINIKRGQVICAILGGWALCPWEILASAPGFLAFMSGYTVFLGPFAGVMVVDYWLVHRGKVDVPAMYDPQGRYRYWNGINWRAAVALLVSVTPTLPGLIGNINRSIKVGNASHLFDIAWLFGFFSASVTHWSLSTVFPARETFVTGVILPDDIISDAGSSDAKTGNGF